MKATLRRLIFLAALCPLLSLQAEDDGQVLRLLPSNTILLKGRTLDFRARIGEGGSDAEDGKDVTERITDWTSSVPTVAAISHDGHLVALQIGATTVSCTYQGLRATAQVTVDAVSAAPFLVQPSHTKVNAAIAPAVKLAVQDNLGRLLPGLRVTIGIAPNTSNPPGELRGRLEQTTDANGAVSFDDLKLNYMGGYALQATVSTPTGPFLSTSAGFNELPVNPCLAGLLAGIGSDSSQDYAQHVFLGCPDSDGDGLFDAWEAAGGIDFNGDGIVEGWEKVLTMVDPVFPDGTFNPFPHADPHVKDIFVVYDWMELPDQLTGGRATACVVNPLPAGPPNSFNFYYPYHSDQIAFDQLCISGVAKGHSDAPDPAALKMVIDAFAAHNIRLHLIKGHALPHANVIAFGTPKPASIADTAGFTFYGVPAINFYALKLANFNARYNGQSFSYSQLFPFAHYAIFAHRTSCDSVNDCIKAESINADTGRNPFFGETGLSEQPGNDIIVSMGAYRDVNRTPSSLAQGGTFMHELGHNLGLEHGGPLFIGGNPTDYNQVRLNYKPNYLSVMNYNHQQVGIGSADPACAHNDYVCKTTPVKVRLDYSSFTPGFTPTTLDENNGTEAAGINIGNNDIGYVNCPLRTPIPGMGPVDFNCDGTRTQTWCAVGCDFPFRELNNNDGATPNGTPGSGDILKPFEDWPNLVFNFQALGSGFNDGAAPDIGQATGPAKAPRASSKPAERRKATSGAEVLNAADPNSAASLGFTFWNPPPRRRQQRRSTL